jgi:putative ABC transport system permease protein
MMHDIVQHVRHASRFLLRTPAFTLPAIASLALGIGVNTTVFSVFSATLLRPLGAGDDDLVRIFRSAPGAGEFRSVTYDELAFVRRHATSFSDVAGHQIESVHVTFAAGQEPVSAEIVAGNYFGMLGATPVVGRAFAANEDGTAGVAPVIVISDRLWRRSFAADRAVTGRTIVIGTVRSRSSV